VPAATLQAQIRAGISWSKLIQRRLRPQIEVGDGEIDAAIDRIKANVGKPEYLLAEIFLAVDNPNQDEEVRRLADRLVEQIRQGGNFAAVARQFSQSADAANGGDLGWIQAGVLPPELDKVLHDLRPGQLSPPIRDFAGYHIILMREQRTVMAGDPGQVKLTLRQLVLPLSANADAAARIAQAEEIRKTVSGCDAFAAKARAVGAPTSGDLGSVRLSELPPEVARVVRSLPAGEVSEPIRDERGLILLMACQRSDPPSHLPSRDQIANTLGDERLDMLQRRLLRDLRRAAFVDVRP
jgi:peptidyl-prolyl cis-trans isomerase SurA